MIGNAKELIREIVHYPKGATRKEKEEIIKELILRRRRQVIVHSLIYYRYNSNLIGDGVWDKWARQLVALQQTFPKTSKKVKELYKKFKDFDASTGYHLCEIRDEESVKANSIALHLIKIENPELEKLDCEKCYISVLENNIFNHITFKIR